MKTLLTLCLFFLGAPPAVAASDYLRTFATCTGQLSARMEWQWMFDGIGSEQTQAQRDAMIALLDATMSPDEGRRVLNWRIEAKVAHAALLTRASFSQDPEDAAWALEIAERQVSACTSLLLS